VDTTRWNVSTVFQENFSNLANKGEFLGKYSKWSAYPTNYLVTDKQGYYDPGQISVKDITVDGTIRRVSPVSSSSPRRHPRCLVPPVMATAGNGQIGFKTGTSTAGFHVVRHSEYLHARACRSPGATSGSLMAFSRPRRTSWWGAAKRDQGPEPAAGLARSVLEPCTFSTTGYASGLPRWISLYDLHTAHLPAGASVAAGTEAGAGLDSSRLRSATHTRTVRKTPQTSAVSPLARTR
jgi:hypothetical protein